MASIETTKYVKKDGRTTVTYRVVWREYSNVTGSRHKQGESFTKKALADNFKSRVDLAGQCWPENWVPGMGFVEPGQIPSGLPTLDQWAPVAISARSKASERSRADYARDYRLHISPVLGEMKLDKITPALVGVWVTALRDSHTLSEKSIKNHHGLLSSMLNQALREGHIHRNPAEGLGPSTAAVKAEEQDSLTVDEYRLVLAQIQPRYRGFVECLASTGARFGEVTALPVGSLANARLSITQAWKRQPAEKGGGFKLGDPKSKKSRRTITVTKDVVAIIEQHSQGKRVGDMIFQTRSGPIRHSNFYGNIWLPAVRRARMCDAHWQEWKTVTGFVGKSRDARPVPCGCPETLQQSPDIKSLRHSHASWLIDAGVPMPVVQERLGHESIQTTIGLYTHLDEKGDARAVEAIERAFNA